MSSTQKPACEVCAVPLGEEDPSTTCRACRRVFHLVCAGVDAQDPKFGCASCFQVPGNVPRIRIRTMSSESTTTDLDETVVNQPPSAPPTQAPRDDVGGSNRLQVPTTTAHRGTVSRPPSSVSSRRSHRDELLLGIMQKQSELMADQMKRQNELMAEQSSLMAKILDSDRRSRGSRSMTTEGSQRVQQWVNNVVHAEVHEPPTEQRTSQVQLSDRRPPPQPTTEERTLQAAPTNSRPPQEPWPQSQGQQWQMIASEPKRGPLINSNQLPAVNSHRVRDDDESAEDTHLNVTRITTSAEFRKCIKDARRAPVRRERSSSRPRTPPALPRFNGGDLEWLAFIANYIESTREYRVSDLKNMERLQVALGPGPMKIVSSTMVYSSSLADAMDQLRITYGDPVRITAALEKEALDTPKVDQSGRNLQLLSLKTRKLLNSIQACGYNDRVTSESLVAKLQEKLPYCMARDWGKRCLTAAPTLERFAEYLQEELVVALRAGQAHVRIVQEKTVLHMTRVPGEEQADHQPEVARPLQPVAALAKITPSPLVPTTASTTPPCPMCAGHHRLADCPRFGEALPSERMHIVEQQRLCWRCLRYDSRRHSCASKTLCGVDGCDYRHHLLLHAALTAKLGPRPAGTAVSGTIMGQEGALYKILPMQLQLGDQVVRTFGLIDEGSAVSLIDAELANALGVEGQTEPLTIRWTDGNTRTDPESRRVCLRVTGHDGQVLELNHIHTMTGLDLPDQSLTPDVIESFFPSGGGPEPFVNARPKILIGLHHAHLAAPREIMENSKSNFIATRTRLGWVIYGGSYGSSHASGLQYRVCHHRDDNMDRLIRDFFAVESFGVRAAPPQLGKKEARALQILEATTKRVGERYEAGLLWARDSPALPASRTMCLKRARNLQHRMQMNPVMAQQIEQLMDDYLRKGYCRDVSNVPPRAPTWYLPIFPVTNPNKPGKVRLVWDAAAEANGSSLNSFLLPGPDLLTPLADVLVRFRERKVAVTADVAEMFHQIVIREKDKDAQRFLWLKSDSNEVQEFRMEVMSFGATCSPSTAQYVQQMNARRFEKDSPAAVKEILTNYYVDDQLSSFDDEETAQRVVEEVIRIQSSAGFELKKWRSSHPAVLSSVKATTLQEKPLSSGCASVLGMAWNCATDVLQFSVHNVLKMRDAHPLTRRKILSGAMSLFDPLGLAANVVIKAKILMKSCLCLGWDVEVPEELKRRWQEWCDLLLHVERLSIPRFHNLTPTTAWELHTFVDASEEAYAALTYARGLSADGVVSCSLVMAKTRVAPVRATTMPRMELLAAVLGTRLAHTITKATTMVISRRIFWTDSLDCICWINSSHRRYHAFVAARINEILDETREIDWKWLPSHLNVADDATRLSSPADNPRWYRGPAFLYLDEKEWPRMTGQPGPAKEEILPAFAMVRTVNRSITPDATRFSSWQRLLNVTAYALRFLFRGKGTCPESVLPSTEELRRAEEELFREAQQEKYGNIRERLQNDPNYPLPKVHILHKLCPVVDNKGLLRVNGRLPPALFPAEVRQPIILPSDCRAIHLFIEHQHRKYLHANHETVVNEVRRHYHVPGLRRLVARISRSCLHCQLRAPRVANPLMGVLPEGRAAVGLRAFSYCGLDYFGPYEVVIGRRREKRWVALFTCLTTRAVHLEVAHSLDMDSCMMCVRMMMARRNVTPIEMRSDCGTNFRAATKELDRFAAHFPRVKWVFNPPGAPHMGGAWERMVRTVKRCFSEVVGDRALSEELLRCALVEVEWVVNSHPLTNVSLSPHEPTALTPNDFLTAAGQVRDVQEVIVQEDNEKLLKRSWRSAQQIADHFWRRFSKEVIPVLNLRTKWFQRAEPLQVGDVVMVADEARRGGWRRGRIAELLSGRSDDQVRQVRIDTPNGQLVRPVVKVAKVDAVVKGDLHGVGDVDHCPLVAET